MDFTGERYIPNKELGDEIKIEHLQRYYSIVDLVKNKVVLDAASGEGYGSNIIAGHAKEVHGLDIDDESISHAKQTYVQDNLKYYVGSVESLPFEDNFFDVVVSFETIEHVNENIQRAFLKEIKRVLKDDGILVISTPDKHIYSDLRNYKNEFHVKEFYQGEFKRFLKEYFLFVDVYYQKRQINYVLDNNNGALYKPLNLEPGNESSGKYMIAVCGENVINNPLNSIVLDEHGNYDRIINRILELQDDVDQKNSHLQFLDRQIEEKDSIINELQSSINIYEEKKEILELKEQIKSRKKLLDELQLINEELDIKKKSLEELRSINEELETKKKSLEELQLVNEELEMKKKLFEELQLINKELDSKKRTLEELKVIHLETVDVYKKYKEKLEENKTKLNGLDNRLSVSDNSIKEQINRLLQKERDLNNILISDGWKFLTRYYRFRDFLIPPNSKRGLFLKSIWNLPELLRFINKENVKKFFYYLKTEDPQMIQNRITDYLSRYSKKEDKSISIIEPTIAYSYEKLVFPKYENPEVSIIIPVYNNWQYTYMCLKSILENTENVKYEVVIADDMSTDETTEINRYTENIIIVRDGENRGFLLNCNNAAQYTQGEYIFFLNNDTQVQKGWLDSLVQLIESDESIGMVGSKLVYPDGRLQESGGIIWNDASGWNYGRLDDPNKPEYNYVKEVDYISGAAIMIRKTLWEKIGGFDERYVPAYYEDTDLSFEVRKHGYKVLYQPKSVVVHFEGISHGKDENAGLKAYQVTNKNKFLEKWQVELEKFHFPNAQNVFQARDRSRDKKTILVIDHYVPHYDKDAGGRCTYFYLNLFVKMGYNVKFLGDNFYQHEPYTSDLQKLGIEVLYGNYLAKNLDTWLGNNGSSIDYIYLNRPHISIKYIDKCRKNSNAKIIYFGHDLHYLRELRNYEIEKNPELLKSSERWKKIEFELFEKADVIHVVGEYEQQLLQKDFPKKAVRNIPLYIFNETDFEEYINGYDNRSDILFVGGFNHKPNKDGIMWFQSEVFPEIVKKIPEVKLYIVGSNPPDEVKEMASKNIVVTGFVSDEELATLYSKCRIVVVPLRYGAGVKGKVVEALKNQVPLVTTTIGAEGLHEIEDYLLIEDDGKTFADKVCQLYTDEKLWGELSKKSRDYTMKYFSVQAALQQINNDFGN